MFILTYSILIQVSINHLPFLYLLSLSLALIYCLLPIIYPIIQCLIFPARLLMLSFLSFLFCFVFVLFFFFRAAPMAYEGSRARVKSELQLPVYTTATQDLSCIYDLHHSSQQHQILNPLSEARDQARNLMVTSWIAAP